MKRTIMAAMVLSLAAGSWAFADPPQDSHHDRNQRQEQRQSGHHDEHSQSRDQHRGYPQSRNDQRGYAQSRSDQRGYAQDRNEHDRADHDRGDHDRNEHDRYASADRDEHRGEYRGEMRGDQDFDSGEYVRPHDYYEHRWHRGDRLPPEWREEEYVIPDYQYYNLPPPPPGYYWVRVDDNAVLAVIATGLVADVVYNIFH